MSLFGTMGDGGEGRGAIGRARGDGGASTADVDDATTVVVGEVATGGAFAFLGGGVGAGAVVAQGVGSDEAVASPRLARPLSSPSAARGIETLEALGSSPGADARNTRAR